MVKNYLMHYGVKGMKWGVRNYQNADGTLTAAGKERYSHTKNSFREYSKAHTELFQKENRAYDRIQKEQNKYENNEYKKLGLKNRDNAYDKAYAQNKLLDSGKLQYSKSVWNAINKIEDQSYSIFGKKESQIYSKYEKKYVKLGEKFVDDYFNTKGGSEIKYKDLVKLGKKTYNHEHQYWQSDYNAMHLFSDMDKSNKYQTIYNDKGNWAITKR